MIGKDWVSNKIPYAFDRIAPPQLHDLSLWLVVLVVLVTSDFYQLALPLWTVWERINLLEERSLVLERWPGSRASLPNNVSIRIINTALHLQCQV